MTLSGDFGSNLNAWLAALASGRKAALRRGAARFNALLAANDRLEIPHPPRGRVDEICAPVLNVTSGLHRGASMKLTKAEYLLGSADDCDIVLRDKHAAARHCRVTHEWSGFVVSDLRAGNAERIAPETVTHDRASICALYGVGDVSFTLSHTVVPHEGGMSESGWKHALRPGVLVLLIAGIALAVVGLGVTNQSSVSAAPLARRIAPGNGASVSELLDEARRALSGKDLRVNVVSGRMVVDGRSSDPALKGRIRILMEDLRGTIPLDDHVDYVDAQAASASAGPFPLAVRGVLLGNPSYFLTDAGVRYFVGGTLPDGAEVIAISQDALQFKRNNRIITYPLQ